MNEAKNALIKINSTINGETFYNKYQGEYTFKNGIHTIAYDSYSGTDLTRNGIQAAETSMLLHRAGAFEGDMLFDIGSDTVVKYDAFMVGSAFLLHTDSYNITVNDKEVRIIILYTLHDGSSQDVINGRQEITVSWQ